VRYRTGVAIEFSAAHFHGGAGPECARVHGHNYRVEAAVESGRLEAGMVLDFRVLREILREAVSGWTHRLLNDTAEFRDVLPTTENLARIVYEKSAAAAGRAGARLIRITVWEKNDCWASYGGEAGDART